MSFICRFCGVDCTDMTSPATRCNVDVDLKLPCGHVKKVPCYQTLLSLVPPCTASCERVLECGHTCGGTCGACAGDRLHQPCQHICGRPLICGHTCRERCGLPCHCAQPCEVRCGHSRCQLVCAEACAPCLEPCLRRCPHHGCDLACSEPCQEDPCTQPCPLLLTCGHRCIGLCGDPCPDLCRQCQAGEFEELFLFGEESEDGATFVKLADCGHIIHAASMDEWVKDQSSGSGTEDQAVKLVECPRCKTSVRSTIRYNGVINKQLKQVEAVKKKLRGEVSEYY